MTVTETSSSAFFETKYRQDEDPWRFARSVYELSRYDAIVACLAGRRYRSAFEPGCSVGVLTEKLAALCDFVLAIDFAPTAIAQARRRCAGLAQVELRCASLTECLPPPGCDLLVLSEIGYYYPADEWRALAAKLLTSLPVGATVLAVHWLGTSVDHQIHGDEVHSILAQSPLLLCEEEARHAAFRLNRWRRVPGEAQA